MFGDVSKKTGKLKRRRLTNAQKAYRHYQKNYARPEAKRLRDLAKAEAKERGEIRRVNAAAKKAKRISACVERCDVIRAGGRKKYMAKIGG